MAYGQTRWEKLKNLLGVLGAVKATWAKSFGLLPHAISLKLDVSRSAQGEYYACLKKGVTLKINDVQLDSRSPPKRDTQMSHLSVPGLHPSDARGTP